MQPPPGGSKNSPGNAASGSMSVPTQQQNLAVSALGVEYIGAPYETRRRDLAPEDVEHRFVGVVGTELSDDPPIPGAPRVRSAWWCGASGGSARALSDVVVTLK